MRRSLPAVGLSRDEIFARMKAFSADDIDWRRGRVPLYVFKANDEVAARWPRCIRRILHGERPGREARLPRPQDDGRRDRGHGPLALSRARRGGRLFHDGRFREHLVAVKACRDWLRRQTGRPDRRGNIVLPYSAHPAFTKAARLMDLELRRVPVAANYRADVDAMAARNRRRDDDAGRFGAVLFVRHDRPDRGAGRLAQQRGLWLHVDACVGGYLAPFVAKAGYPVPAFDFAVPGVASLSADLHKFGFCPKPASTVFYRSTAQAACQPFEIDEWPGGKFATATLVGTRPGGAIAGAWATLQSMGEQRLCRHRPADHGTGRRLSRRHRGDRPVRPRRAGPVDSVLQFRTRSTCCVSASLMAARGWLPGLVREPKAMHLMLSMLHAGARRLFARFARFGNAGATGKWYNGEAGCDVLKTAQLRDFTPLLSLCALARTECRGPIR